MLIVGYADVRLSNGSSGGGFKNYRVVRFHNDGNRLSWVRAECDIYGAASANFLGVKLDQIITLFALVKEPTGDVGMEKIKRMSGERTDEAILRWLSSQPGFDISAVEYAIINKNGCTHGDTLQQVIVEHRKQHGLKSDLEKNEIILKHGQKVWKSSGRPVRGGGY